MKFFFDYVFYKFGKAYCKWDKTKGITGICALTLMQSILIADLLFLPLRLIYPVSTLAENAKALKFIMISIILVLFVINDRLYDKQYHVIKKRFENESYPFIKGVLVVLAVFAPLIIFITFIKLSEPS